MSTPRAQSGGETIIPDRGLLVTTFVADPFVASKGATQVSTDNLVEIGGIPLA